jgi:hypothetical protein
MHRLVSLLVLTCAAAAVHAADLSVIATAETHAMLNGCDCPRDPGGGLAARSAVIAPLRRERPLLLIDGGGFAGGGMYDQYTEGRSRDSLRTLATVRAMGAMGYAAAIGDDELQFDTRWLTDAAAKAGLALVSANVRFTDGSTVGRPFVVETVAGKRFGITGVTTQDRLLSLDPDVTVDDPIASLKTIWPELCKASDYQVILSHLGEDDTRSLARAFPEVDILVNGHRKSSDNPAWQEGPAIFMSFGYQGKRLAYAHVTSRTGGALAASQTAWIDVPQGTAEDSSIVRVISSVMDASASSAHASNVYDLYIMSQCPYGLPALAQARAFAERFPGASMNVWFIGAATADSTLTSLHGPGEVADEMQWLAVKSLYPSTWSAFLDRRGVDSVSTASILRALHIDTVAVARWVKQRGWSELSAHYQRSTRLGINASPTLLVNNMPVDVDVTKDRLAKIDCAGSPSASRYCDSIPVCLDDRDCRAPGKIGHCRSSKVASPGKRDSSWCEMVDDAAFVLTILRAADAVSHLEYGVIGTTVDLFPAAVVDTVEVSTRRGQDLLARYKPQSLPYYVFGPGVTRAVNYAKVQPQLTSAGDSALTFRDGVVAPSYLLGRPALPNTVQVLVDPMFVDVAEALRAARAADHPGRAVTVSPILLEDPSARPTTAEERLRREEALRWLVLRKYHASKLGGYLDAYAGSLSSSYWTEWVTALGIRQRKFLREIADNGALLTDQWRLLQDLGVSGPVAVLVGNREIVQVRNRIQLADVLRLAGMPDVSARR